MKSYQEMVTEYKKRQKDTLIDAISTGLTYAISQWIQVLWNRREC